MMNVQVRVEPAGKSFSVEAGQSVLEAGLKAGITLKHSCRDGQCGECRTTIVSGRVAYADELREKLIDSDLEGCTGLMCQARPLSDLVIDAPEVTELEGISIQKFPVRVLSKQLLSDDVVVLRLAPAPGIEFRCMPGQYIDLQMRDGNTRSYSMAATDDSGQIELHIRRMPGGQVSGFIYDELKERAILTAEGPFGTFYLRGGEAPIVLTASGTGFAPIKAIVEQLIRDGNERPVHLYWGGRRLVDLYYHQICLDWATELPWLSYIPVLSEEEGVWGGRTGFVHQAVVDDYPDLSGHEAYVCGAPIVVASARRDFVEKCSLDLNNFHSDAFV
ncbi:2Fe-2S iron-sulfur cluster binding domain-containing protein [Marinobacterium sp. D7]|uniref:FAD-binding oxidoreductase n=1 Tax=Marinobacterium ramblicola TaxID=2849041 RepID=UPI001C2CEA69|nr:FAD-binding oxidoreductase [Marinobacterium ramblicola]MBV1790724.1 2Fe-2S iron-sulfur cluster binding domain-containing protein [Marinobacterium ramblicola]